jgi:predicted ATPase/class 3 adenylate cyclase
MVLLPTGTVTFLFTDLEGSTRLWEEHPDAMQGAMARHDEILREVIAGHDGHIVKTTGDGVHAAFASAADGVRAAVAAQLALGGESWRDVDSLRVRMGLHTGPAELRDGDYYGTALNRAARLMSVANGGQIVLSLATEELVRDDLQEDHELMDLGDHRLRDLSRTERVFQVCAPGLPRDFPALRTLDSLPGNLPRQLTSFIGRDEELTRIAKAMTVSPLVTLTGVGGVGKTRLALQVAGELLAEFPDGAWFCELAVCADPESMAQVIALSLGTTQRAGMSLDASIVAFLRPRAALVVLDNCEHLLDAAARVAEQVLRECPGVRILATSREGLGVAGEQTWPVRSLSLPDATSPDMLERSDAVRLFVERAGAARPSFGLDGGNAAAVAEICRRLDGVPLAIELAAARVVAMSPTQIAGLLDERFRLLVGGRRTAVERHQTLRTTVEWSYELLDPIERAVFDRLGVFPGSFDADAAVAVAAGEGVESWDVLDALSSLTAKSMIGAEGGGPVGEVRHQMLETLRQYARERLDAAGDPDEARRRHATHYAALAEVMAPALTGRDELAWRPRFRAELDNFRAVVVWALDRGRDDDLELGLRVIAALGEQASTDAGSGVSAWAATARDAAEHTTPGRRTAILGGAAWAAYRRGDTADARDCAHAALRDGLPPDCPAPGSALMAQFLWGEDPADALSRLAAEIPELDVAPYVLTHLLAVEAYIAEMVVDLDRGRPPAEAAVASARSVGNPTGLAVALGTYGRVMRYHDPDAALAALEESISLTQSGAGDGVYGLVLGAAAELRAERDLRGALAALREGIVYSDDIGDYPMVVYALDHGVRVLKVLEPGLAALLHGYTSSPAALLLATSPVGDPPRAVLDTMRQQLGDDAYERAVDRGAAMTLREVTQYALPELDRLLAEVDDA